VGRSLELIERDQATVAAAIYRYTDIAFQRGEGVYLYDFEGRKYLDFVAGIATMTVGHCHPAVVEAICDQARTFIHGACHVGYMEQASGGPVFPPVWLTISPRWRSWCLESPRTRRKSSLSVCRGYRGESSRGFMNGEAYAGRATNVI
jgi:hypothetical protein